MILSSVTSIRNVLDARNRHISRVISPHNKCRPISQNGRFYWKYFVFLKAAPLFQNPDEYIVSSRFASSLMRADCLDFLSFRRTWSDQVTGPPLAPIFPRKGWFEGRRAFQVGLAVRSGRILLPRWRAIRPRAMTIPEAVQEENCFMIWRLIVGTVWMKFWLPLIARPKSLNHFQFEGKPTTIDWFMTKLSEDCEPAERSADLFQFMFVDSIISNNDLQIEGTINYWSHKPNNTLLCEGVLMWNVLSLGSDTCFYPISEAPPTRFSLSSQRRNRATVESGDGCPGMFCVPPFVHTTNCVADDVHRLWERLQSIFEPRHRIPVWQPTGSMSITQTKVSPHTTSVPPCKRPRPRKQSAKHQIRVWWQQCGTTSVLKGAEKTRRQIFTWMKVPRDRQPISCESVRSFRVGMEC
jgi:hypothetical protein